MPLWKRLIAGGRCDGRREGENLGEFCDRWHSEDRDIRNALPSLLEVADIGDELAKAVREWSLELNNTTINDCVVLAIRYQQTLAKLEVDHED